MRLTIVNLLISGANGGSEASGKHPCTKGRKNEPAICGAPPFGGMPDIRSGVRRAQDGANISEGPLPKLNRHFAVPDRTAGRDAFRRIDDGVGVDAMVAVEIVDGAGLAEMLDAEGFDLVAAHAAEPSQCRRMAVDHGDD